MSLRIAMLGWACLSLQEREGTGYNLHASELAAELARRGHRVSYLRSGIDYSLRPGMSIAPRETWRGVECFDLVNSPNLAIGMFNFRNVAAQISSPEQSALVVEWLRECAVQVVHIHSLEGYSFDLIAAVRTAGIPVAVTPHNYFSLCPQVDLLYREQTVCTDYEGGLRCEHCLPTPEPTSEIRGRRWTQSTPGMLRSLVLRGSRRALTGLEQKSAILGGGPPHEEPFLPETPTPAPRTVNRPCVNARLLTGDHHLTVLNNYGERRRGGVHALSSASVVLCPSRFLLGVHTAMGVDPRVLRHVQLGQPHFDAIAAAARASAFDARSPWQANTADRPLRFGFFGSTRYNKGLDVFVNAITLMDPALRVRCHFHIRASGDVRRHRAALRPIPQASFCGGYTPWDLPSAVGDFDIGVVPTIGLENSPLVVMEHLHAGKFTIASELGGVLDFIRPGINGLLTPAGDAAALAESMADLLRGKVAVPSPAAVRTASGLRMFPSYGDEVEGILRELAASPP